MASRLDIATVLALIVVISSIALTDQSEISWISHSLAGLAGMTLMVSAIALGAMLAQRIKGDGATYLNFIKGPVYISVLSF